MDRSFRERCYQCFGICLWLVTINLKVNGQSFFEYQRSGQYTIYLGTGISKYYGDLSNDRELGDINPHFSLGISLPIKPKLYLRPELSYYRISAADSDLPDEDSRRIRNLSFRSDNFEGALLAAYELHSLKRRRRVYHFRPYVFGGVGFTYFNPKAQLDGVWHELQPLHTEGIDYTKLHLVIPLGTGLGYQITSQTFLSLEISYRFTLTDYLDDVSNTYRDVSTFTDPIAATLADRRPEIGVERATAGLPRGNAENNDGYLFFGVKLFYQLPGSGPLRRKR